jgi:hypothetical protein
VAAHDMLVGLQISVHRDVLLFLSHVGITALDNATSTVSVLSGWTLLAVSEGRRVVQPAREEGPRPGRSRRWQRR